MKNFKSERKFVLLMIVVFLAIGCKTQSLETSAPFSIVEKVYFNWVGGKQGTQGTTVRFRGRTSSLNLSFSKIYFQNREYGVVPQFNSEGFLLEASFTEMREPVNIMGTSPVVEDANKPPNEKKKIPFDLEDDEAIIVYSVNGRDGYHKVTAIKELDKEYRQ
jgi:hypothetical protein